MTTALITNIQKFSIHDGPGIRTTLFLKGCPLLCAWCHNPETQIFQPEMVWHGDKCIGCGSCLAACPEGALSLSPAGISLDREKCTRCGACAQACPSLAMERLGREISVAEALAEIDKDAAFYEQSKGGVTMSGGEPLSQIDFTCELLRACQERGYHTAVDTGGYVPESAVRRAAPLTDLFLYDIKHLDPEAHLKYMQASNEPILRNLRLLIQMQANIWIRVPYIPTVNDQPEHIGAIGQLLRELGQKEVYLLPYHKMAQAKYARLGLPYSLPTLEDAKEADMQEAVHILQGYALNVHIGG